MIANVSKEVHAVKSWPIKIRSSLGKLWERLRYVNTGERLANEPATPQLE